MYFRCTDNNLYRIGPSYSILDPGRSVDIMIERKNGMKKSDRMIIELSPANSQATNAKQVFEQQGHLVKRMEFILHLT